MFRLIALSVLATSSLASMSAFASGLYFCNETTEPIRVAFSRYENSVWWSKGWIYANPTECKQLTTGFTNTRYYMYAMGTESGKIWGGTHNFCLNPFTGFEISNATETSSCTSRKFFSIWTPDMITGRFNDTYAVVIGPNNLNLNHPRAER